MTLDRKNKTGAKAPVFLFIGSTRFPFFDIVIEIFFIGFTIEYDQS